MLLKIDHIAAAYGNIKALFDVNITVEEGELVALVGANGAGKSTLMRVISGLLPAAGGAVMFQGADITRTASDKRVHSGISQVPEGRQVFAPMSVEDNLRLGAFSRAGTNYASDMDHIYQLFPVLRERRQQLAGTLSGGEQQMLAIGRALMADPKLLILDEPSLGLAPKLIEQIRDIIVDINKQGTSVLLIEQNAMMALSIANYGYIMETGKVVMDGDPAKLLADEDVKEFYLGLHADGGEKKSFRDVKHYKRRKRWLS